MKSSKYTRRKLLKDIGLTTTFLPLLGTAGMAQNTLFKSEDDTLANPMTFSHSVCRWCYQNIPLAEFADACVQLGISAIDLLKPEEWQTVFDKGLSCSLATDTFASITDGFNDPKNHKPLQEQYEGLLQKAAKAGIQQVIVFSGNRRNLTEEEGLKNCKEGLLPLVKIAEKLKITMIMELLNSKVDHPDYQCDHTAWGVKLVDQIGSPHFRLLYDIYHMQIMEGDIIATITKYKDYINHYHTAGVPGRHEINKNQELQYPAIIRAIQETGFKGYVAQEFIPTYESPITALGEAIKICTI